MAKIKRVKKVSKPLLSKRKSAPKSRKTAVAKKAVVKKKALPKVKKRVIKTAKKPVVKFKKPIRIKKVATKKISLPKTKKRVIKRSVTTEPVVVKKSAPIRVKKHKIIRRKVNKKGKNKIIFSLAGLCIVLASIFILKVPEMLASNGILSNVLGDTVTRPAAPGNFSVTVINSTTLQFSYSPPTAYAKGYYIYCDKCSTPKMLLNTAASPSLSWVKTNTYKINNLTAGTTYQIAMTAYNLDASNNKLEGVKTATKSVTTTSASGTSAASPTPTPVATTTTTTATKPATATTTTTKPATPQNLRVLSTDSSSITFSFSKVMKGTSGYYLYCDKCSSKKIVLTSNPNLTYKGTNYTTNVASYQIKNLAPATTFQLRMTAFKTNTNGSRTESNQTAIVPATTKATPTKKLTPVKPVNFTVAIDKTSSVRLKIRFNHDKNQGHFLYCDKCTEKEINVDNSKSLGDRIYYGSDKQVTGFDLIKLKANTKYTLKLAGYVINNGVKTFSTKVASKPVTITTPKAEPDKPTNFSVSNVKKDSVDVKFNNDWANVDGYYLYVNGKKVDVHSDKSISSKTVTGMKYEKNKKIYAFTYNGLKPNTKYKFQVTAYKTLDSKNNESQKSAAISKTTKKVPVVKKPSNTGSCSGNSCTPASTTSKTNTTTTKTKAKTKTTTVLKPEVSHVPQYDWGGAVLREDWLGIFLNVAPGQRAILKCKGCSFVTGYLTIFDSTNNKINSVREDFSNADGAKTLKVDYVSKEERVKIFDDTYDQYFIRLKDIATGSKLSLQAISIDKNNKQTKSAYDDKYTATK